MEVARKMIIDIKSMVEVMQSNSIVSGLYLDSERKGREKSLCTENNDYLCRMFGKESSIRQGSRQIIYWTGLNNLYKASIVYRFNN